MAAYSKAKTSKPNNASIGVLSDDFINRLASYTLSDSKNLSINGLNNIKMMLERLNMKVYEGHTNAITKIQLIKNALYARLEKGVTGRSNLEMYLTNGCKFSQEQTYGLTEISNEDIEVTDETVKSILIRSENKYINEILASLYNDLNTCNPEDVIRIDKLQDEIDKYEKQRREYIDSLGDNSSEDGSLDLDPKDEKFINTFSEIYDEQCSPQKRLKTGMSGFNALINGGLENERLYSIFGLQGEGKSLTLLDIALQVKEYNKGYIGKDPTKHPTICYITLENSKKETLKRAFTIQTNIRLRQGCKVSKTEAITMFAKSICGGQNNDEIKLKIEARDGNTVNTSLLQELYESYLKDGNEIILFVVDYLMTINPVKQTRLTDGLRNVLGDTTQELKNMAKRLGVPILTAGQLNREANRSVDEIRSKGSHNILDGVTKSHIAESSLITNILDYGIIIVPEYVDDKKNPNVKHKFLGMKSIKDRDGSDDDILNGIRSIYQPYYDLNMIRLVRDYGTNKIEFLTELTAATPMVNGDDELVIDENTKIPDNSNRYKESSIISTDKPKLRKKKNVNTIPVLSVGKVRPNIGNCSNSITIDKTVDERNDITTDYSINIKTVPSTFGVFKDENGNTYPFNPNWRSEPRLKDGMFNYDSLSPEVQMRNIANILANKKYNDGNPNKINGKAVNYATIEKYSTNESYYTDEYTINYDPYGSKEERLVYHFNIMNGTNFTIDDYPLIKSHYDLYRKGQIGAHDIVFNAFRDMRPEKRPAFVKMTNEVERQCQLNSSTWKSTMKKIDSIILKKQTTNCKDQ